MVSGQNDPPVVFTNTGVQLLAIPIRSGLRFTSEQIGLGWQRCRCQSGEQIRNYWYIQWQLIPNKPLLFLAIDTTLAPAEKPTDAGYFCKEGRMFGDFEVQLDGLLGLNDVILEGIGSPKFMIRSAQAEGGEPKDVHLIVDFGNNRTGGLLVEFHGDLNQDPSMQPLQMIDRTRLDAWDEKRGELIRDPSLWWFSSRAQWATAPFLEPPRVEEDRYSKDRVKGLLGSKEVDRKTTVVITPDTFMDLSQIRLGKESGELSLIMRTDGKVSTSVSSPKRYLWARDSSWLDGSIWHMADPSGRFDPKRHSATLRGPMLRYISEAGDDDEVSARYDDFPSRPSYAPRNLMMGALYEILTQAYSYVNSTSYRTAAGYSNRARRLRSISMTFPSGMVREEREELKRQANRAVQLFYQTAGRLQGIAPEFNLSVDEASAAHLTYMWSEIQKLGKKPSLWFELMARDHSTNIETSGIPSDAPGGKTTTADPASPSATAEGANRRPPPRHSMFGGPRSATRTSTTRTLPSKTANPNSKEVRIACIDIGGGTSDLMIAKYTCETHAGGTRIIGETLHRDGIYVAGDQLIKRVLERIIVPQLHHALNLEPADTLRLFGPEVTGSNSEFRGQRINWLNHILIPLAQAYMTCAVENITDEEISHTNPDIVAPEVLDDLQRSIDYLWGAGIYQVNQPLQLFYNIDEFDDIVDEVFGDIIFDFCDSIAEHQADIVLLAGLPTKLNSIRELVVRFLPLPKSRVISMYRRYVGNWYPYQSSDHQNPGVIEDPKSTVVVGAAVEFAARFGMLSQFKFKMTETKIKESYFWGLMTDNRIDEHQILFSKSESEAKKQEERKSLHISDQRLIIGRKRRNDESCHATPVYLIKADVGQRMGEIDVRIELKRTLGEEGEEQLEIISESVHGVIAGEEAVYGQNLWLEVRTLAAEKFFLDTGGLDQIEL